MSSSSSADSNAHATDTHQYWSVDSAPAKLTQPLSVWVAPSVLALFTGVATLLLLAINRVPFLVEAFPNRDLIFSPYDGTHSVPLRIFVLSFYIAYGTVVGAKVRQRVHFLFELTTTFIIACGVFDLIHINAYRHFDTLLSLHLVEILSGLLGYFIFSWSLLSYGSMPALTQKPAVYIKRRRAWPTFLLTLGASFALALYVDGLELPIIYELRSTSLMGGTGPGVFLFLPALFFGLYVLGTLRAIVFRGKRISPDVTVIIPAHNESHVIKRTLDAVDAAAEPYDGVVHVLVLNNNSSDDTFAVSSQAIAQMRYAKGRVIDVPTPGKSHALNRGVAETKTAFLVRIDADTQILPQTLVHAMRHFSDPEVGVVGGLPLPPGNGPFDRARLLEVLLKHGYYQIAYGAIDAIVGIPGMFAAYRVEAVRAAGGFVQGMNGEDTDVSLRIGEMGYRLIGDPRAEYVSEVPVTYWHMREQRMRWFRSVYHVSSRNKFYLNGWHLSLRGKVILPFMLLNSARRAMQIPLAIFGALHLTLGLDPMSPITGTAVLAVLLGAPMLMGAVASLANGRAWALIGLPEYALFRALRSYFTLESVLSIAFAPDQPRPPKPPKS
jgi:glycosyltransferase involved in cell wall biosynthesis